MFIAELCSRSLEGGSANPRSNDESLTEARTILPVLVSISTAHVTIQLDLNFGNDTVLPVESVSCWEGIVCIAFVSSRDSRGYIIYRTR